VAQYAFLSYQTADKRTAGRLKRVLADIGVKSFLAHEDIDVSEEWRLKILEEIRKADVFICLLSKKYLKSSWCVQESGIAASLTGVPVIPLSLDGTKPKGFISHIQSVTVDPDDISLDTLMPALLKHDFPLAIGILIDRVAKAGNFRGAEAEFEEILPHVPRMNDEQIRELLEGAAANDQVHHARLCAHEYIPPLLKSHGRLLKKKTLTFLKKICAQYA
jgi:hypothetical protein